MLWVRFPGNFVEYLMIPKAKIQVVPKGKLNQRWLQTSRIKQQRFGGLSAIGDLQKGNPNSSAKRNNLAPSIYAGVHQHNLSSLNW